jgi:hypothetical protein
VRAFFTIEINSEVENGQDMMFWTNRWLHGQCITDLAPSLLVAIPHRQRQQRTLQDALQNHAWVSDIQGILTAAILIKYLELWDLLDEVQQQQKIDDTHIWRLDANGQYSARSAYDYLFLGTTMFRPFERIWKSCAPPLHGSFGIQSYDKWGCSPLHLSNTDLVFNEWWEKTNMATSGITKR